MLIEIKSRWNARALFALDVTPNSVRITLEAAVKARTYLQGAELQGADLQGVDLRGADLRGAYLRGADLRGADLRGADLGGAYLRGADLRGADLRGADLRGADLRGADLRGAKAIGQRPYFQVGPIGSRSDYLIAWLTDKGIILRAGCFWGSLAEFRARLADTHGDNEHGQEYHAALVLIEEHARLWTPKAEEEKAA